MKNSMNIIKQSITVAITAMLLLCGKVAYAQHSFSLNLAEPSKEVVVMRFAVQQKDKPFSIVLKDAEGNILHTEKSRKGMYERSINFSKLGKGSYYVEQKYADGYSSSKLVKDNNKISIEESREFTHRSINYQKENSSLMLRCSSHIPQTISILITDSEGQVVYRKRDIVSDQYFGKVDLSALKRGVYHVTLFSSDTPSHKTISL